MNPPEVQHHYEEKGYPGDPLGPLAFASLRAEEEDWLQECFIPPPGFERMAHPDRSVVLFGGPGSGKTAICRALESMSIREKGKPLRLLVHWKPSALLPSERPNLGWVRHLVREMLDACVAALIRRLMRFPEDYWLAPPWTQARLTWFIRRFTLGDPAMRWGPLTEGHGNGTSLIRQILSAQVPEILHENASLEWVVAELISALQAIGMEGIWVLTDGLEGWVEMGFSELTESLKAFLSTLDLFGQPGLVYKLFLPAEMEPALSVAAGIARRRIESLHLRWDTFTLQQLVERRLAFAFGRDSFRLKDLCEDAPAFLKWLEKAGGTLPREWLDQVAILAEYYAAHPQSLPIRKEIWQALRQSRPPRIRLDEKRGRIIIGGREVYLENLPAKAYEMLCFLYRRGGEMVSRAELYYQVYHGLNRVPFPTDEQYEPPTAYRSLIDTNIWRLRQAIEPDPDNPVLLITRRGRGVSLQVRW